MGHQESIVTTKNPKDFNKLVERVKQLGKDYYEGCFCDIPHIGVFKQNVKTLHFPNAWMGDDYLSFKPIVGTQFLYAAGDRTLQYDVRNFVNVFYPCHSRDEHGTSGGWEEGEKIKLDFSPIMIFIEEFPKAFLDEVRPVKDGLENAMIRLEEFIY